MANEEQLAILKSGVKEWDRWRRENQRPIDLRGAGLVGAELRGVDFHDADLSKADLSHADLHEAIFRRADLSMANLSHAGLQWANFRYANLDRTAFSSANLEYADFRSADLTGADLRKANLKKSRMFLAKLLHADLRGAQLSFVHLGGTYLGSRFEGALGLESAISQAPSTIGPEALEWAQGKLPKKFLKGIGYRDWEILNAKLHDPNLRPDEVTDIGYEIINLRTKGPIQVNTLFISYARMDNGFVEFLEKKLDDDGIRSWRDVHDMVAGPVQPQIERAIDLNGTVLLVLSKNSLGSDWVEWEVQKARDLQKKLEGEGKRDAHVLCPVAIDDAWKESKWSGPLMNQLLKYNILDFSKWEDAEAVETVYARLKAGIAKYYSDFRDSGKSA